jgi:hypothetical protein
MVLLLLAGPAQGHPCAEAPEEGEPAAYKEL